MVISATIVIGIATFLLTAIGMLAGFLVKTGQMRNEIENIKEQQLMIKADLTKDIENVKIDKADKVVVDMILGLMKDLGNDIRDIKLILMEHVKEG